MGSLHIRKLLGEKNHLGWLTCTYIMPVLPSFRVVTFTDQFSTDTDSYSTSQINACYQHCIHNFIILLIGPCICVISRCTPILHGSLATKRLKALLRLEHCIHNCISDVTIPCVDPSIFTVTFLSKFFSLSSSIFTQPQQLRSIPPKRCYF